MERRPAASSLTWEELRDAADGGAVALLPVGSTEAHGPHLPLHTDVVIAEEVADRARRLLEEAGKRAIVLPPLAYGVTEFAKGFSGTVSIGASTLEALVIDIAASLHGQGLSPLVLVNHHLEPEHFAALHRAAASAAARAAPARVIVPDHRKKPWALELGEEFCRGGSHAGSYETSLMLAAAPGEVRAAREALEPFHLDLGKAIKGGATSFLELGGDRAYFGDPAAASAAEGNALFDKLARHVAALVLSAE
ncbi:creatininase family protein [Vulgatibacter incomptus]|uniref:Creatinine amidohydrolase n=1 Tax=Vulgatibacter incomptus TaxID=1391653 RepID=A0A0K1PG68_9BACT|nr:creatininase family protein [Vulgatibacter incomptus]AKU92528.1 Creatinine amidohydrolase [Vulgatibacter incomptus]